MKFEKNYLISSILGNILEWYDFALYAYFFPIISKLYFSFDNSKNSYFLTYLVFFIGFAVRPIGAIIFGHIGDVFGRKTALLISIAVITISTFLMGCVPGYETLGLSASFIFTLLRMIQALSISGECTGTVTYLIEISAKKNQYFFGSLVMASVYGGLLLGAVVSYMLSSIFNYNELLRLGWRFAFYFSAIIGIIAFYTRYKCKESNLFLTSKKEVFPFAELIKKGVKQLIICILLSSLIAVVSYTLVAYLPELIINHFHLKINNAMAITIIPLFSLCFSIPFFGKLVDKYNFNWSFQSIGCMSVLSLPLYLMIFSENYVLIILSEVLLSIIIAPYAATVFTTINNVFPVRLRYSGVAVSYNVGMMLFGGTTPLISLFLTNKTGLQWAPCFYLLFCSILSFISLLIISKW